MRYLDMDLNSFLGRYKDTDDREMNNLVFCCLDEGAKWALSAVSLCAELVKSIVDGHSSVLQTNDEKWNKRELIDFIGLSCLGGTLEEAVRASVGGAEIDENQKIAIKANKVFDEIKCFFGVGGIFEFMPTRESLRDWYEQEEGEININQIVDHLADLINDEETKRRFERIKYILDNYNIEPKLEHYVGTHDFNAVANELATMLDEGKRQIILTGAPGTGKTHNVENFIKRMGANSSLDRNDYFVQFHPSYDYTDFVEGLRPAQVEGHMEFVRMDGIFKSFCRKVIKLNEEHTSANEEIPYYYFVIDEINRADLSAVFGELMYCLEEDKRGEEHKIATQYRNIPCYEIKKENNPEEDATPIEINPEENEAPIENDLEENATPIRNDVFADGFYIPENVVIIGTMNDIDRSVETFDFALRRRFHWMEVGDMEDEEYLDYLKEFIGGMLDVSVAEDLAAKLKELNKIIVEEGKDFGLNKSYAIGPAYLGKIDVANGVTNDALKNVFDSRIEPLLKEYCRGQNGDRITTFINHCRGAFGIVQATGE